MNKTKKDKNKTSKIGKNKTSKISKNKTSKNKIGKTTKKKIVKNKVLKSSTPLKIRKISNKIAKNLSSYSPTINQQLVTLKSIPRKELLDCNIKEAYELKEPLKIGISGSIYGKTCYNYNSNEAKKFLLKNLAADKHVDIKKIVPPLQIQSNCWFNAFFVTFFISDKGRKFFHFLRQLMIQGKNNKGKEIPENIRNAFALLNFGIDASLTGNKYAYELNTNVIIHKLFKSIPQTYKQQFPHIVDVDEAGNPLLYYISIINYLNDNSIFVLFLRDCKSNWKDVLIENTQKIQHLPHIIVLEVFDNRAAEFNKKPVSFTVNDAKYAIDSAVVRDVSKQHFCSMITCEKKQMGYDGMSFHRIVPMEWKNKLNTNLNWQFEGTNDYDNTPLIWNFTKSYQMLFYYRV